MSNRRTHHHIPGNSACGFPSMHALSLRNVWLSCFSSSPAAHQIKSPIFSCKRSLSNMQNPPCPSIIAHTTGIHPPPNLPSEFATSSVNISTVHYQRIPSHELWATIPITSAGYSKPHSGRRLRKPSTKPPSSAHAGSCCDPIPPLPPSRRSAVSKTYPISGESSGAIPA